MEDFALALV